MAISMIGVHFLGRAYNTGTDTDTHYQSSNAKKPPGMLLQAAYLGKGGGLAFPGQQRSVTEVHVSYPRTPFFTVDLLPVTERPQPTRHYLN